MIDVQVWMPEILTRLQKSFGHHLSYLGLQGSYRRGEAHDTSDIDIVVLLDVVSLDALDMYRDVVYSMPEGYKACGFISEVKQLVAWPRHELFSFKMDTDDYYGRLDDFIPPVAMEDIRRGANISASALVHTLTHNYLYGAAETKPIVLKEACKSAFFLMQLTYYLKSGKYCRTKQELFSFSDGTGKEILSAGLDFCLWRNAHSEKETFAMLLEWCASVMVATAS